MPKPQRTQKQLTESTSTANEEKKLEKRVKLIRLTDDTNGGNEPKMIKLSDSRQVFNTVTLKRNVEQMHISSKIPDTQNKSKRQKITWP